MNNRALTDYLQSDQQNTYIYNILGDLQVTIRINKNPYDLPMDTLFKMAARYNKKRSFLFVSKLLGKHIPVNPHIPLLSGLALGILYLKQIYGQTHEMKQIIKAISEPSHSHEIYQLFKNSSLQLPEKTIIIGFAETATALGHSFFNVFKQNAVYFHTTRETIPELSSIIQFEEEHSHATSHRCYLADASHLSGQEPIVLVDDEMTTGKTTLNIIRAIQEKFPRKVYSIVSLLDWRSQEDLRRYTALEKELDIKINCVSLIEGQIDVIGGKTGEPINESSNQTSRGRLIPQIEFISLEPSGLDIKDVSSIDSNGVINPAGYCKLTGRFGIESNDRERIDKNSIEIAQMLKAMRVGPSTLCLGTGEFMYFPMRVSALMGDGIHYQSTTRSPIIPYARDDYGTQNAFSFPSIDDPTILNYFYNIHYGQYDDIFVFFEREVPKERLNVMLNELSKLGCKKVNITYCVESPRTGGI